MIRHQAFKKYDLDEHGRSISPSLIITPAGTQQPSRIREPPLGFKI